MAAQQGRRVASVADHTPPGTAPGKTSWVVYIGPHRPGVTIAVDGRPTAVDADVPTEVPAELAKSLLLQEDNWRAAEKAEAAAAAQTGGED